MSQIAELRVALNMTQRQLAEAVGVTETTIRNWERNRNGVEWFVRVAKLCTALNCNPNDLYLEEEAVKDLSDDQSSESQS